MRVVAASMHHAGSRRSKGAGFFLDGQSIHIGTQAYTLTGGSPPYQAYRAVPADSRCDLDAHLTVPRQCTQLSWVSPNLFREVMYVTPVPYDLRVNTSGFCQIPQEFGALPLESILSWSRYEGLSNRRTSGTKGRLFLVRPSSSIRGTDLLSGCRTSYMGRRHIEETEILVH